MKIETVFLFSDKIHKNWKKKLRAVERTEIFFVHFGGFMNYIANWTFVLILSVQVSLAISEILVYVTEYRLNIHYKGQSFTALQGNRHVATLYGQNTEYLNLKSRL
jgi:hypothetical protein